LLRLKSRYLFIKNKIQSVGSYGFEQFGVQAAICF